MNKNYLEGKWDEVKGKLKQAFSKLTDDDLKAIEGHRRDVLYGKLISTYGWGKEQAKQEVDKVFG